MWHSMWGWDGGWGFFGLMHVLWWVLLIAAAVVVVRALAGSGRPRHDSALQILRERFARGEIDAAEFEQRSKQLKG
ncbi:SHOCT domain-containing protein [Ramlibacter tataouinensis]|uniref:SHOCT domain-containing protein n=1 Tax=Ramlibacter tataouinensis TaxID=94132 RepID=UPI0022F3B652|nr:SHOCT domain-containing protein [Ramlibacter tataouinensis]WBY01349.1 SHOCT domain-containing protein [Ramlibacter tataouinensis]